MNKKEAAVLEGVRRELRLLKSFRLTEPVLPDVHPPLEHGPMVFGWVANVHSRTILKGVTSAYSHANRYEDQDLPPSTRCDAKGPITMHSTRLLALRALRHAVEQEFLEVLMGIDTQIANEINTPTRF